MQISLYETCLLIRPAQALKFTDDFISKYTTESEVNTEVAKSRHLLFQIVQDAEIVVQEASILMAQGISDEQVLGQTARTIRDAVATTRAGTAMMMPCLRMWMMENINKGA